MAHKGTVEDISGIRVSRMREEATVSRLLRAWTHIIESYNSFNFIDKRKRANRSLHDVGYVYNERANVSLLAAAAWQAGLIALEEYPTKRWGDKKGRADLYFSSPTIGFEAEAKIIWPGYRKLTPFEAEKEQNLGTRIRRDIDKSLQQAYKAAKKNLAADRDHRLGISFICPTLSVRSHQREVTVRGSIEPFIRFMIEQASKVDHHAMAWAFPASSRHYLDRNSRGEKRFYPGVMVLLRQVD
jgi:hypothetical protein